MFLGSGKCPRGCKPTRDCRCESEPRTCCFHNFPHQRLRRLRGRQSHGQRFGVHLDVEGRWNGLERPTTFISGSQLTAAIPAQDIASAGPVGVSVFSPAPGGGASANLTFTVLAAPTLALDKTTVARQRDPHRNERVWRWARLVGARGSRTRPIPRIWSGSTWNGITTRTWVVKMPSTPGCTSSDIFR